MSVREEGGKEVKLLRATVLLQEVKPVSGAPRSPPKPGLSIIHIPLEKNKTKKLV
jgi:hypothetical protein